MSMVNAAMAPAYGYILISIVAYLAHLCEE